MTVLKRNGVEIDFNKEKIFNAIMKANKSVDISDRMREDTAHEIADHIEKLSIVLNRSLSVEEIQDEVEKSIIMFSNEKDSGYSHPLVNLFKAYTIYRYEHALSRAKNTTEDQLLSIINCNNEEANQENANKNPTIIPTQRDYMAGIDSKDLLRRKVVPPIFMKHHDEGIYHIHDTDYRIQKIYNCCLINLEDMLQNGTVISGKRIDKPHLFSTACNITTQIIAQVASSQYGGQTINVYHLVPFVDISRQKFMKEARASFDNICKVFPIIKFLYNKIGVFHDKIDKIISDIVEKNTKIDINRGIQTIQYQIVTLMTTNGQAPFCSLFMYLNEATDENLRRDYAYVIEEILKQRIQGIKNIDGDWVPAEFPKLLYVLQDNNIEPDHPYFYLTKLAAECTASRMVPDYMSEKKLKELKDGQVYGTMGCALGDEVIVYKLNSWIYVESFEKLWKRLAANKGLKVRPQFNQEGNPNLIIDTTKRVDLEIYDTNKKDFVKVFSVNRNISKNFMKVKFSNGRFVTVTDDHPFTTCKQDVVLCKNLKPGDEILVNYGSNFTFDFNEDEVTENLRMFLKSELFSYKINYNTDSPIPDVIYNKLRENRLDFLATVVDYSCLWAKDGNFDDGKIHLFFKNKEKAFQVLYLIQSCGVPAYIYEKEQSKLKYEVEFVCFEELKSKLTYVPSNIKIQPLPDFIDKAIKVISVEKDDSVLNEFGVQFSYDVTTESEHFEFSGIYSHNCRSLLSLWKDPETKKYKFWGRFNKGVITINLPYVALLAKEQCGDNKETIIDTFYKILDEYLEEIHQLHEIFNERLMGTTSDVAPILWQNGAIARLKIGEKIDKYLLGGYSTCSLGYVGLSETLIALTGKDHTYNATLGLEILDHLNDKCAEWNKIKNWGYSIYGTPEESTTYKFSKALKNRFGEIPGITDKMYVTNSYHVDPKIKMDAFEKLTFESKFQEKSLGGAISYVEVPNMKNNIPAVLSLIKHIYNTMIYAELNSRFDFCRKCGAENQITLVRDSNGKWIWKCKSCGNTDFNYMNVYRRTCGYIGSNETNQGRKDEFASRAFHVDCAE